MSDLRDLAADLVARPLVPAPPIEDVVRRAAAFRTRRLRRAAACSLAMIVAVAVGVTAGEGGASRRIRTADEPTATTVRGGPPPTDPASAVPSSTTTPAASAANPAGASPSQPTASPATTLPGEAPSTATARCPRGPRTTDAAGVGANEVRIWVRGSRELRAGAEAYGKAVNDAGGVCGRTVRFVVGEEGALDAISPPDNYTPGQDVLAFVTGIEDPDFTAALYNGAIDRGLPALTGGLARAEHESDWTWPLGSTAAAQTRMMAQRAYDGGARRFAVVYQEYWTPGSEARDALRGFVESRAGATIVAEYGLEGGQGSYASEVQSLHEVCRSGCDFIAFATLPGVASTWFDSGGESARTTPTGAISTLASAGFASFCGYRCEGISAWSPYTLPVDGAPPDVVDYRNLVGAAAFEEQAIRGFLAVRAIVTALETLGDEVTRSRLKTALDQVRLASGFAPTITWGGAGFANPTALPYRLAYRASQPREFVGFEPAGPRASDPFSPGAG